MLNVLVQLPLGQAHFCSLGAFGHEAPGVTTLQGVVASGGEHSGIYDSATLGEQQVNAVSARHSVNIPAVTPAAQFPRLVV